MSQHKEIASAILQEKMCCDEDVQGLINVLRTDWVLGSVWTDDAIESVRRLGQVVADNLQRAWDAHLTEMKIAAAHTNKGETTA